MPRTTRDTPGGIVYHVLNRANGRAEIFSHAGDYQAFERTLTEAVDRFTMRLLSFCLMPNHWHLVLYPHGDGDLSRFMQWLTVTHTHRWHAYHGTVGSGHVYQGRFKSFPVEEDGHFLTVCRYVERNSLRASLVRRAEEWRWCSLWHRVNGDDVARTSLAAWPVDQPKSWMSLVNEPPPDKELERLRQCVIRGRPLGSEGWTLRIADRLGLSSSLRPRGRPFAKKKESG